jgi:hypothetical protein
MSQFTVSRIPHSTTRWRDSFMFSRLIRFKWAISHWHFRIWWRVRTTVRTEIAFSKQNSQRRPESISNYLLVHFTIHHDEWWRWRLRLCTYLSWPRGLSSLLLTIPFFQSCRRTWERMIGDSATIWSRRVSLKSMKGTFSLFCTILFVLYNMHSWTVFSMS